MRISKMGFKWMALILVVCLLSGCAKSLLYWNQARKSFGQGAEMELKSQFADRLEVQGDLPAEALPNIRQLVSAPASDPGSAPAGSPEEEYQTADEKISEALAAPGPLIKEDKMGNALTLKALTCWKTGQVEEARTNAAAALKEMEDAGDDNPRDKALAKAVPGLVALDLAYDNTNTFVAQLKEKSEDARNAPRAENEALVAEGRSLYKKYVSDEDSQTSIAGARVTLMEAAALAGENEDIRRFFVLCELTGLKNRFDFWAQLNNFAARSGIKADDEALKDWLDEEEEDYLEDKDEALDRLKAMLEGGTGNSVYQFWDGIL